MDAIADAWLSLEARCQETLAYFQTFAWCRAWVARFASAGAVRPFIQTAWRGEVLVAVWPLATTSSSGLRQVRSLGEPHAQYSNLLHDAALMAEAEARALVDDLLRPGLCDVAVFDAVPKSSELGKLLRKYPSVPGYGNQASILDLSQYASSEAYTAQLGKLQKRNRNRRRNHLSRLGELRFDVVWPDHPDFAVLVRECLAMKRVWLKETGRFSVVFSIPGYEEFLLGLTGDAGTLTGMCLSVLRAGDRTVAIEIGFLRNRHYYAYLGGFDWELAALSPGKVQMDMTVCWLIDHGIRAYDLLGNATDYKQTWSNREEDLQAFAVPFSWRGRLYAAAWLPTLKPAIKRAYYAMPASLRRLMTAMQGATCLLLYV